MIQFDASYSAEDDKIRIRASARLDAETYARVKAAGFGWAPKQEVFYVIWSPGREDLATELSGGELEDEETTLAERAEARAERFAGYKENRTRDAESAQRAVHAIADNIPMGQPILIGHHSERHARRDAEKIQNGMRKSVKMWETAAYWQSRAAGAIAAAKYKEIPAVRARRIKKLESDRRGFQRDTDKSKLALDMWAQDPITLERAKLICNHNHYSACFKLAEYPRQLPASQYEGSMSFWSALDDGIITAAQAKAMAVDASTRAIAHRARWISHLDNRIAYERAMLGESGYVPPPKKASRAELPLLNYAGKVAYRRRFQKSEIVECEATPMLKADYAKIGSDYRGTVISACGTHRLRTCLIKHAYHVVVLTDSKQHPRPDAVTVEAQAEKDEAARDLLLARKTDEMRARTEASKAQAPEREKAAQEAAPFEAVKQALKSGVQVVVAPQLFPTPPALAARMVELAGIETGDRVLEPSAGTGSILRALLPASRQQTAEIVAVEINRSLADILESSHLADSVACFDFLSLKPCALGEPFERIVANPPFHGASDVDHVKHALQFLRPGGRLVAICANGPRQQAELKPLATTWEELPDGTFADQGTNVRTVLMTVQA